MIPEIDDENADAWTEGAWIFYEMKKYPQAAEAAAKAVKANPSHSSAWRERGFALMMQKKQSAQSGMYTEANGANASAQPLTE